MVSLKLLYEQDELLWCQENARLLLEKKWHAIDYEHIAEELENMGKQQMENLRNRLELLFMHLLKYIYQPAKRSRSWKSTIAEQRRKILRLKGDYPSLKGHQDQLIQEAYADARFVASAETSLPIKTFPEEMPFSFAQAMDDNWWPEKKELNHK